MYIYSQYVHILYIHCNTSTSACYVNKTWMADQHAVVPSSHTAQAPVEAPFFSRRPALLRVGQDHWSAAVEVRIHLSHCQAAAFPGSVFVEAPLWPMTPV